MIGGNDSNEDFNHEDFQNCIPMMLEDGTINGYHIDPTFEDIMRFHEFQDAEEYFRSEENQKKTF